MKIKNVFPMIGLAVLMSSAALAGESHDNLTAQTVISNACIITGGSLSFDPYDPLGGAQVDASTTISVQCTNLMTAPYIKMDQGANHTGGSLSAPVRRLKTTAQISSTDYYLSYNIYSDSPGGTVWDGVTGVQAPSPNGNARTMNVYGRIAASQNVPAATYSDTVVVSVTF
jgi:spore coat protein U-like protein